MSDYRDLTRRDFVRDGALGALLVGAAASASRVAFGAADGKSLVAIVRDEKVQDAENKVDAAVLKKMLDQAVTAVTGESSAEAAWKKLVKPEDTVGIVATGALNKTHAELIEAVTEAIKAAGVPADKIQSVQGKKDLVAQCTALVSLPALKAHTLTGIGTVLKNYITFGSKPAREFHKENNGGIGSIWLEPAVKGKTRIIIIDALRPLCAAGPQKDPKFSWNYNGLIAGTDPVALEAVALKIIMAKRKEIKGADWELTPPPLCVAAADKEYKLGTSDLAKIAIKVTGWEKDALV